MLKKCLLSFVFVLCIANANAGDTKCLATAIYHEANAESVKGQIAVANVIMNRVESKDFPNSVCGVISQKSQFSWYGKTKHKYTNETVAVAEKVLAKRVNDVTNGSLFFHSGKNPHWTKKMKFVTKIGGHKFYRQREI